MAFIPYHDPDAPLANILKISTVNPDAERTHSGFYVALVKGPSPLSRIRREMIAVTVSQLNNCHY